MKKTSEFIVIGGGASGCAVTSTLLSNNSSVTLFEAGPIHHNFYLDIPSGFFKILNDNKYATYYESTPQPHLGGKTNVLPQGNVLGGGTSINAQVYIRGGKEEYNEWQNILKFNNDSADWSWNSLLPIFKRIENNDSLNNEYHNQGGQLNVSYSPYKNDLSYDFIEALNKLGVKTTNDFNSDKQSGVGFYQFMNRSGKRSSAAYAFIEKELKNKKLDLQLNTKIQKILIEKNRAIGVEYQNTNGEIKRMYSDNEIIISAGSFITPKILMLSGIGDQQELKKHNIFMEVYN